MKDSDSRSIVAIILAVGVVVVLVRYVWVSDIAGNSIEVARMWKELLLVIIGVLAGYIAYSGGRKDE